MSTLEIIPTLGDVLASEADGKRSRDVGQVQSETAGPMHPGVVLGQVTATGVYRRRVATATDGSQVARAVLGQTVPKGATPVKALIVGRDCALNVRALSYDTGTALTQLQAIGARIVSRPVSGMSWDSREVTWNGMSINIVPD